MRIKERIKSVVICSITIGKAAMDNIKIKSVIIMSIKCGNNAIVIRQIEKIKIVRRKITNKVKDNKIIKIAVMGSIKIGNGVRGNKRVISTTMAHRRLASIPMINNITSTISIALDKKVYGVPMIEMIGMRICCYILLAVMIARILGD